MSEIEAEELVAAINACNETLGWCECDMNMERAIPIVAAAIRSARRSALLEAAEVAKKVSNEFDESGEEAEMRGALWAADAIRALAEKD